LAGLSTRSRLVDDRVGFDDRPGRLFNRGIARPMDGDGDGNAVCDMGAYEHWEPVAWAYLPLIVKGG